VKKDCTDIGGVKNESISCDRYEQDRQESAAGM